MMTDRRAMTDVRRMLLMGGAAIAIMLPAAASAQTAPQTAQADDAAGEAETSVITVTGSRTQSTSLPHELSRSAASSSRDANAVIWMSGSARTSSGISTRA